MKTCPNCQETLEEDALFCTNCGTKLGEETEEDAPVVHTPVEEYAADEDEKDFISQVKKVSKSYWHFLPPALIQPFKKSLMMTEHKTDLVNSIITLVLFALLVPVYIYVAMDQLFPTLTPSVFEYVLEPFFYLLVTIAFVIAVMFGLSRLMKLSLSYLQVMSHFGALMVLPLTVIAIAIFMALVGGLSVSFSLTVISVLLTFVMMIVNLFVIRITYQANQSVDLVYLIALLFIAFYLFGQLFGEVFLADYIVRLIEDFIYQEAFFDLIDGMMNEQYQNFMW
ncbi:zinc-ribbon domain-containing protein [Pelagirhabdus alkalitolerans]|uniref:Zinc-ribbon domain-containing protein n=1 Tax=Pelagirhabdus alkalitolerans TaxID=1612202 RepID=A0A1G6GGS3_9BACI|nr:zinc-ribbon domain-containing protein [Pelagirhabdus alkalitolerans]SDB81187.1 zinc-ribbon domain-containing protein [Pelagirhabdus alkalitolerans]